jgi:NADH:ubiquinone oxidoreductase subunit 4 (subunit M)
MMLALIGLSTFSSLKFLGVLLIAVFHGFISSALFFGFKMIYKFSKTRNILLNFGILKIFPIFVFL